MVPSSDQIELVEAELTAPNGWSDAILDCDYVIHCASPFYVPPPKNELLMIKPAVDGTLHVLRAVAKYGKIKRVVMTSSVAAIAYGHPKEVTMMFVCVVCVFMPHRVCIMYHRVMWLFLVIIISICKCMCPGVRVGVLAPSHSSQMCHRRVMGTKMIISYHIISYHVIDLCNQTIF